MNRPFLRRFYTLMLTAIVASAVSHACAQDACAFSAHHSSDVCGETIGNRVYLPGQQLEADFLIYVGDSEEASEFSLCLQLEHGVVCTLTGES